MIPASTCVFYLFKDETDELVYGYASGEHAGHFVDLRIPRGQRLTGWVAANRLSVLNSDPVLDLGEAARSMRPPLRSCLSTSISAGEELVGVLTAYSSQRDAFTEDHQRILEAVAGQIAQTLRDSLKADSEKPDRFREQMEGLPSLRQLEKFIEEQLTAPASRAGLALLYVGMRPTNRSGPLTDSTLSAVTDVLRQALRGSDVLFRLDDSTLVVVLTSTDRQTAINIATHTSERLRGFLLSQGNTSPNAAVGVAAAPHDGVTLPVLIDVAKREASVIPPPSHPPSVH
jgi:GGDEF domain-containing protein/putative methionine-R-sulfoxide reductase with GAF domain